MNIKKIMGMASIGAAAAALLLAPYFLLRSGKTAGKEAKSRAETPGGDSMQGETMHNKQNGKKEMTGPPAVTFAYENTFVTELMTEDALCLLREGILRHMQKEGIEAKTATPLWYETYDSDKMANIFYFMLDTPDHKILRITHSVRGDAVKAETSDLTREQIVEWMQGCTDAGEEMAEEEARAKEAGESDPASAREQEKEHTRGGIEIE